MRNNSFFRNLIIFSSAIIAVSCSTVIDWDKQINDLVNGQAYVIPVGESTITLNDILNQFDSVEFIDSDENNIYVKYNDSVYWTFRSFETLDELEQLVQDFYPSPVPLVFQNQSVSKDFVHNITLGFNTNTNEQRIDMSEMNSAKVQIQIDVEDIDIQPDNIRITTLFPTDVLVFKSGGSSFIHQPTLLNGPEVISMSPFTLYTPNSLSSINLTIRVEVIAGNTPIVVKPTSRISVKYKLYDVDSKVYYGYFSPVIALGNQEKTIDMTEFVSQVPSGGIFKLAEPSIIMDVYNNTGMKIGFDIDSIKAFKANDPSFVPVYARFNSSKGVKHVVNRIANYGGPVEKTTFVLDHSSANGEISHFFDNFPLPDRLTYKFKISNARLASDPLDFMIPNGRLTAKIGVKVPLKLNAGSRFQLRDTLKNVNLDSILRDDLIEKAQLVLRVTNGLPLKGTLSLNFLNSTDQIIDGLKLLADSTIKAPQIDDEGKVITNSNTVSDIVFMVDKTQIPKLKLTKKIVYSFLVESEVNRKITLQKENSLKLKLGIYLKGDQIIKFE